MIFNTKALNSGFSLILTCNVVLSDEKSICAHAVKFLGILGILDNQMLLLAPLNINFLLRLAISASCRSSFTFFSHVHYFRLFILCNFCYVLSFKVTALSHLLHILNGLNPFLCFHYSSFVVHRQGLGVTICIVQC